MKSILTKQDIFPASLLVEYHLPLNDPPIHEHKSNQGENSPICSPIHLFYTSKYVQGNVYLNVPD